MRRTAKSRTTDLITSRRERLGSRSLYCIEPERSIKSTMSTPSLSELVSTLPRSRHAPALATAPRATVEEAREADWDQHQEPRIGEREAAPQLQALLARAARRFHGGRGRLHGLRGDREQRVRDHAASLPTASPARGKGAAASASSALCASRNISSTAKRVGTRCAYFTCSDSERM